MFTSIYICSDVLKCTQGISIYINSFKTFPDLLGTCTQPACGSDEESRETEDEKKRLLLLTNHTALQQDDHVSNGCMRRPNSSNPLKHQCIERPSCSTHCGRLLFSSLPIRAAFIPCVSFNLSHCISGFSCFILKPVDQSPFITHTSCSNVI